MTNLYHDGVTLDEYVETLLREGKTIDHPAFEPLIKIYGRASIEAKVEATLEKYRGMKDEEDEWIA